MSKKILVLTMLVSILMTNLVFAEENPDLLKTDREYLNKTYKTATGDKAPKTILEYEPLRQGMRVLESNKDYLWFAGGNDRDGYGNVLYKSKDLGDSFEFVYAFDKLIEGIHITPKNTILVSISNDRWSKDAKCEIHRSIDGGKTFTKVLDVTSGAVTNWNFTSDNDGYIFVSEYGYKNLPNNARKIYRSKDNGASFQVVYNPAEKNMSHNHVIQIDKNNKNIIYQSIGDKYKEIIVSKDRGNTWSRLIYDYNPTSMLQIDNYVLIGLDNHPKTGIVKIDKATNTPQFVFSPEKPIKGSIYDMLYANDIIYAGLLSYSQDSHTWPGSMYISKDKGNTWENVMIWPKITNESGIGMYNFYEKDGYGFINGIFPYFVNGMAGHYTGTMKFKLLNK